MLRIRTRRLITLKDAAGAILAETSYDPLGSKAQAKSGGTSATTTSYTFDERNRLTRKDTTIDGKTYSINYGYDQASNLKSVRTPDARQAGYTYDNLNRIDVVSLGAITLADYAFRPDNLLASIAYGNGITITQTYIPARAFRTLSPANVSAGASVASPPARSGHYHYQRGNRTVPVALRLRWSRQHHLDGHGPFLLRRIGPTLGRLHEQLAAG